MDEVVPVVACYEIHWGKKIGQKQNKLIISHSESYKPDRELLIIHPLSEFYDFIIIIKKASPFDSQVLYERRGY